jgi:hypothetical protein
MRIGPALQLPAPSQPYVPMISAPLQVPFVQTVSTG